MKEKTGQLIRAVTFCLLCFLIFLLIQPLFQASNEYSEHAEMMIQGYYDLPEDSADLLFLGSSHVYRFWQSAFAWKEKGIASSAWSTSNMPGSCALSITQEMMKTQSPKVLCVEASMFMQEKEESANKIFLILPHMRNSREKKDMILHFCKRHKIKKNDRLAYFFPFWQFHSRWYELNEGDFRQTQVSYLNSCYQEDFLKKVRKNLEHYTIEQKKKIGNANEKQLREYLEYCQSLDCKVVFYFAPCWNCKKRQKKYNYMSDIIEEYGFTVLNYNDSDLYESVAFDLSGDIQDRRHANVRGSYKFTMALSDELIRRYQLQDHRQEEGYAMWDEQAEEYYKMVMPYLAADRVE